MSQCALAHWLTLRAARGCAVLVAPAIAEAIVGARTGELEPVLLLRQA